MEEDDNSTFSLTDAYALLETALHRLAQSIAAGPRHHSPAAVYVAASLTVSAWRNAQICVNSLDGTSASPPPRRGGSGGQPPPSPPPPRPDVPRGTSQNAGGTARGGRKEVLPYEPSTPNMAPSDTDVDATPDWYDDWEAACDSWSMVEAPDDGGVH